MNPPIRLTQYSSGAGCGCKIAPKVLDEILAGSGDTPADGRLLVAVDPACRAEAEAVFGEHDLSINPRPLGTIRESVANGARILVR